VIDAAASVVRHARANRCFLLMVALISTLAVGPWLEEVGARAVLFVLAGGAFVSAVQAVGGRRRAAVIVALASATLVLALVTYARSSAAWGALALVAFVLSGVFTLVPIFRYIVRAGAITVDKIYAAIGVYLLAGFIWGGVYALVELLRPGSFQWTQTAVYDPKTFFANFLYLSFVTLASLGYGDITPVTPQARSLALLEVIFGTFYVVVIIARLVSGFDASKTGGSS